MTSQPSAVTTTSSSMRAAPQPSFDGQNVSSANTMPSFISSGWSSDTRRAEDRLLPDREPDAMAVLQREGGFLVREAELLRRRPHLDDLGGGRARAHQGDRAVHVVAGALVGVALARARRADREGAVVAGAVAVEAVQDVEERGVAGADHAVGEHVRVRRAALAGDRVDALDVLRAQVVERLGDDARRPRSRARPGAATGRAPRRRRRPSTRPG